MNIWALLVVVTALSAVNPALKLRKTNPLKYFSGYVKRLLVIGLVFSWIIYFSNPAFTGPFYGMNAFFIGGCFINLICTFFKATILSTFFSKAVPGEFDELEEKDGAASAPLYADNSEPYASLLLVPAFAIFMSICCYVLGWDIFTSAKLYAVLGEVSDVDPQNLKPLSLDHIRTVSQRQAIWRGDKEMSDGGISLASKFTPGEYNISRSEDTLQWIAPLEYRSFRNWFWSTEGTPGYISVSAEDFQKEGKLKPSKKEEPSNQIYVESAYFGENLRRHIYFSGYQGYDILDVHTELNPANKPVFVVALGTPTYIYDIQKINLVLTVDPESGTINPYKPDEIPEWIDRIYPEALVLEYLNWWGKYHRGWRNTVYPKDSLLEPTRIDGTQNLRLVWGSDNQCYWFTGMTATSQNKSDALVSFTLVNCRTAKAMQFKTSGLNEQAALNAANSAVSDYGWKGSDCILYYLYGDWAYVVPVIDEEGIFQRIAIVRMENGEVALGKSLQEAIRAYQQILTKNIQFKAKGDAEQKTMAVHITRIQGDVQEGRTVYFFEVAEFPGKVFTASSLNSPNLPTTMAGDWAKIAVLDSDSPEIPVQKFTRIPAPSAK